MKEEEHPYVHLSYEYLFHTFTEALTLKWGGTPNVFE